MAGSREMVQPDYIIEQVVDRFPCRALWSEGRPCLEYQREGDLAQIAEYVREHFGVELLDVFFTAVESLPLEP